MHVEVGSWGLSQRETENLQLRELRLQQLELAVLHSSSRLLRQFGWIPWLKLLRLCRSTEEEAVHHSCVSLSRRCLLAWKAILSEQQQEISMSKKLLRMRADHFRRIWHERVCWEAWRMLLTAMKLHSRVTLRSCVSAWHKYCSFGVALHNENLMRRKWSAWVDHVAELKGAKLLKSFESDRIATGHARRVLQAHVLQGWQQAAERGKLEAQRIKRHAEAWIKIHSWLDELHQDKRISSRQVQSLCQ